MIPINEVPKASNTNIVPFTTANIIQIPLNKFTFTQLLEPPSTYEKALSRSNTEKWIATINTQNKTLTLNGTWEIIARKTIPIDHKILEGKWVFKIKRDRTYKAR